MERNKQARDIMVHRLQVLDPNAEVADAVRALLRKGHSGAPVVDEQGTLLGVFSEYDCVRGLSSAVFSQWPVGTVSSYMTQDVDTVSPDMDLAALSTHFIEGKHRRLMVVEDGKLLGLICRSDLLRALESLLRPSSAPTTYEIIARRR